jgi:hypothetical protein
MRYILEGEWSGYTSAQRRICHRRVVGEAIVKQIREQNLHSIRFTDNT